MNAPNWGRVPAPVVDLLRRIQAVENRAAGWSDAVASDVVSMWFLDQGVDPNIPPDQVPADDPPHVYERLVRVRCVSPFQLDQADLDAAIAAAVTGTGVRVEDHDTADTHWTELEALGVTGPDGA